MATTKKTTTRKPATTKTTAATATTSVRSDEGFRLSIGSLDLSKVDVKAIASDTAYATVGAGDRAVEVVRDLPQKLETLRKQRVETFVKETPARVETLAKDVPAKLQAEVNSNLQTVRKELQTYATRGRKVVESIRKADSTKKALEQTENARMQVKGAVTSIRKTVEQGQEAVEGAVGRIGARRSA
jgi:hypothetical protein